MNGPVVNYTTAYGARAPVGGLTALVTDNSAAAAANNTAAIQAALTAGGLVQITTPGTYYVAGGDANSVLKIYSNTQWILGPGVEIAVYGSGQNKSLLANDAYSRSATNVTITYTNFALTCSVAWTAHGVSVGDHVWLDGPGGASDLNTSAFKGVFPVVSVTDANNFVVEMMRPSAASPTGQMTAKLADKNISIVGPGTLNYNRTGGNNGGTLLAHCVILGGIANLKIENVTINDAVKYCLMIGAVANYRVTNCKSDGTRSDYLKIYGPAFDGRVVGTSCLHPVTGDDTISFQTKESDSFSAYRWVFGDVLSLRVEDTTNREARGGSIVTAYASPNEMMDGIVVDGIHGVAIDGCAFACTTDRTATRIGSLTVRNMDATVLSQTGAVQFGSVTVTTTIEKLTVEECTSNPMFTGASMLKIDTTFTLRQFNLLNNRTKPGDTSTATHYMARLGANIYAGVVAFNDFGDSGYNAILLEHNIASQILDTLTITGNSSDNLNSFLICTTGASASFVRTPNVIIENNQLHTLSVFNQNDGAAQTWNVTVKANQIRGASNGFLRVNKTNATINWLDLGGNVLVSSTYLANVSGGSPTLNMRYRGDIVQTLTPGTAPAVDCSAGTTMTLATGANATVTLGAPSNVPAAGERVQITITQDGTGGRTVAWNAAYIFPTAFSNTGNTANKKTTVLFVSDGTALVAQGANSWY